MVIHRFEWTQWVVYRVLAYRGRVCINGGRASRGREWTAINLSSAWRERRSSDGRVRVWRWRCTITPVRSTRSKGASRSDAARCSMWRRKLWLRFDVKWTPPLALCLVRKCSLCVLRLGSTRLLPWDLCWFLIRSTVRMTLIVVRPRSLRCTRPQRIERNNRVHFQIWSHWHCVNVVRELWRW